MRTGLSCLFIVCVASVEVGAQPPPRGEEPDAPDPSGTEIASEPPDGPSTSGSPVTEPRTVGAPESVAPGSVPVTEAAEAKRLSTELRFGALAWALRWSDSSVVPGSSGNVFYWTPSLEARLYTEVGHGASFGVGYHRDTGAELCIEFFGPPCERVGIDYFVAEVGYAYRLVRRPPRSPDIRAWAFTPRVSASGGVAFFRPQALSPDTTLLDRSPVVGGSVGFDIDFHVRRFFMGWSFGYELLFHTRGPIARSNFFSGNLVPIGRLGVTLGRPVQESARTRERKPPRRLLVSRPRSTS